MDPQPDGSVAFKCDRCRAEVKLKKPLLKSISQNLKYLAETQQSHFANIK